MIAAQAFTNSSRFVEAEQLLRDLITEMEGSRNQNLPMVISAKATLIDTLFSQRSLDEAVVLALENVQMSTDVYGEKSPRTFDALYSLGQLYMFGNSDVAEGILERAYRGRLEMFGEDNRLTQNARVGWAAALVAHFPGYVKPESVEIACAESAEAIRILIKTDGPDSQDVGYAKLIRARCLGAKGDFEGAQELLRQVYEQRLATLPADHYLILSALRERSKMESLLGHPKEAIALLQLELDGLRRTVGEDDERVRKVLLSIDKIKAQD